MPAPLTEVRNSTPAKAAQPLHWTPGNEPPAFTPPRIAELASLVRETLFVVTRAEDGRTGVAIGGEIGSGAPAGYRTVGVLPPLYPEWLGDRSFCEVHGTRFPYVAGEMANGIATVPMVVAMARAGMLGFFGAGGLNAARVEQAVGELGRELRGQPNWGVNLIHSPAEPALEEHVAGLLLRHGVDRISASAFMDLTPAVVRCAATGLRPDRTGQVVRRTRVFAKVSRPEVAEKFMAPAPPTPGTAGGPAARAGPGGCQTGASSPQP
jgi:hypothetical protein